MNLKNIEKKLKEWNSNEEDSQKFVDIYTKNKDRLSNLNVNILQSKSLEEALNIIENVEKMAKRNKIIKEIVPEHEFFDENMINMILFAYKKEIKNDKQLVKKTLLTIKNNASSKEDIQKLILKKYLSKISGVTLENKDNANIVLDNEQYLIIKPEFYEDFILLNPPECWCISSSRDQYQSYIDNYGSFYIVFDKEKDDIYGVNLSKKRKKGYNKKNKELKGSMLERMAAVLREQINKADQELEKARREEEIRKEQEARRKAQEKRVKDEESKEKRIRLFMELYERYEELNQ